MAIRYSGDVEVRMSYEAGVYRATLRAPGYRGRAVVDRVGPGDPRSPAAYDEIARRVVRAAERRGRRLPLERAGLRGQVVIRRVFQAACPIGRGR